MSQIDTANADLGPGRRLSIQINHRVVYSV